MGHLFVEYLLWSLCFLNIWFGIFVVGSLLSGLCFGIVVVESLLWDICCEINGFENVVVGSLSWDL